MGKRNVVSIPMVQGPEVTDMLSIKSSFLYNSLYNRRPAPSLLVLVIVFVYALLFSGCASSSLKQLAVYDFTDARLVVEAPIAPPPAIITNSEHDMLGVFEGSAAAIFTATTAVVKETHAAKARRRLKRAAEQIDVSMLIADGILDRSERFLPFVPARAGEHPDLVLLLHINEHGIYSGPAFDGRTEFFLDAFVELIDDHTGDTVWEREISIKEPISDHVLFSNIRTSGELSDMSQEEMVDAMKRISTYTADTVVQVLRRDIARAKR